MNVDAVATSLGVSTSLVRTQLQRRRLRGSKGPDGHWSVTVDAVEDYRRDVLGQVGRHQPTTVTRAKMRAAKLGRVQTPEHRRNAALARSGKPLQPEHRAKISAAQAGKSLDPDHLAKLRAYHVTRRGKPMSMATRRKIAASLATAYAEGRRSYSTLENRAADLLVPLGFERNVVIDTHVFDFGRADGILVEVNGCAWHDHRALNPTCPIVTRRDSSSKDDQRRALARLHDRPLIELWQCEEANWPTAIALIA